MCERKNEDGFKQENFRIDNLSLIFESYESLLK